MSPVACHLHEYLNPLTRLFGVVFAVFSSKGAGHELVRPGSVYGSDMV